MATPETFLTLGQAAKAANKGKGTISKAIKAGKLSVAEKEGNQYKIDPAELFRVFPAQQETHKNVSGEQLETHKETHGNRALEIELKLTQEILRREEAAHAETKAEKGRLLDIVENQTRLLTHLKEESSAAVPPAPEKGFWGKLLGKSGNQ